MNQYDQIEQLLRSMDLRQKVGQMMMIGFPELFTGRLPDRVSEMIDNYKVGGIGIFARNAKDPETMSQLTGALQDSARRAGSVPLLLTADQEGGVVMQVTERASLFPGQMAIGATGSTELACDAARIMGEESLAMGLNLICAPVLDVNLNPDNPIIGIRSLGEDPAAVATLGAAMLRGYEQSGILACAKHFPGHGSTTSDTHLELPVLRTSLAELEDTDLAPFKAAVRAGVPAIMTAHICFPELAPDGLPATLSPAVLTGLLRRKMGFEGVIITDCLEMQAIQKHYGTVLAAVAAVKAGADILLICHTLELQKGVMKAICNAVTEGEIPESRIDESVRRILNMKLFRLPKPPRTTANGTGPLENVGSPAHRLVERKVARKAITLARNEEGILPLSGRVGVMALVYPETMPLLRKEDLEDSTNFLVEKMRTHCQTLMEVKFNIPLNPEDIANAIAASGNAEVTVVCTSSKTLSQEQDQGALVNRLLATGRPIVTVAMRNPYDARSYPAAKTHLLTYGYRPCSIAAFVAVLFGEARPSGKLPVSIPGVYRKGDGLDGY